MKPDFTPFAEWLAVFVAALLLLHLAGCDRNPDGRWARSSISGEWIWIPYGDAQNTLSQ